MTCTCSPAAFGVKKHDDRRARAYTDHVLAERLGARAVLAGLEPTPCAETEPAPAKTPAPRKRARRGN